MGITAVPQSFVMCEGKLRQTPISPRLRTKGQEHNLLEAFYTHVHVSSRNNYCYFHNITIFVADFIFAWGGRRGITGTVNYKKKPPSPPTITVENFYFLYVRTFDIGL